MLNNLFTLEDVSNPNKKITRYQTIEILNLYIQCQKIIKYLSGISNIQLRHELSGTIAFSNLQK